MNENLKITAKHFNWQDKTPRQFHRVVELCPWMRNTNDEYFQSCQLLFRGPTRDQINHLSMISNVCSQIGIEELVFDLWTQ